MKVSKYQMDRIIELQEKAFNLYKGGTLTTRQVGAIIGRSYTWVYNAIKACEAKIELSTIKIDKE